MGNGAYDAFPGCKMEVTPEQLMAHLRAAFKEGGLAALADACLAFKQEGTHKWLVDLVRRALEGTTAELLVSRAGGQKSRAGGRR